MMMVVRGKTMLVAAGVGRVEANKMAESANLAQISLCNALLCASCQRPTRNLQIFQERPGRSHRLCLSHHMIPSQR